MIAGRLSVGQLDFAGLQGEHPNVTDSSLSADEKLMAERMVAALNLQGVSVSDLSPTMALFGHQSGGLGLDSIDALEIALMVQQQYGVALRSDDEQVMAAFASLRSLTGYVLGLSGRSPAG
jgi:acyl carrier protein